MKENYRNLPWHSRKVILHQYPLTRDEKLELAEEMAEARVKVARLEAELSDLKKSYKEQIDMFTGQFSQAAAKFKRGLNDPVEIECDVFQDFEKEEMVFVPIDSSEELTRTPMTEKEKMPNLFTPPNRGKIIDFPNQGEA